MIYFKLNIEFNLLFSIPVENAKSCLGLYHNNYF